MSAIRLIVGLGNPGPEHVDDRHNAGFWFVDRLATDARVELRHDSKYAGNVARATIAGESVWLLEPTTWMNLSGRAVAALARYHRIEPASVLVVHDELDLPPGAARLKRGGGSGGHNGLKDTTAALGTDGYWRLRLGIGHPRELYAGRKEVADFVLDRPSREHQQAIDEAIDRALAVVPLLVGGAVDRASQKLHTEPRPPKPPRSAPAA